MSNEAMDRLRAALAEAAAELRTKRKLVAILASLPDDDARRRVLGAAAVLLGHADAAMKP